MNYVNARNFTVPVCDEADEPQDECEQGDTPSLAAGDLGAEVIRFIDADDSPTGKPFLAVANEISGTTSVFEIIKKRRR